MNIVAGQRKKRSFFLPARRKREKPCGSHERLTGLESEGSVLVREKIRHTLAIAAGPYVPIANARQYGRPVYNRRPMARFLEMVGVS